MRSQQEQLYAAYHESALYERENDVLFARSWVNTGSASRMASPGDAIPVTVAGLPLILLRDENGCIRGFHNVCRGDARGQAVYILDKIKAGVMSLGGSLSDIVRTRVYLQNAKDCEAVSLVHGRYFGEVCPANATFEISQLIDDYLVEIEAEAIVEE